MADEKFHFSSGEILMKEVFLVFFLLGERTSYMTVKKSEKKKCEISPQLNFKTTGVNKTRSCACKLKYLLLYK